MPWKTPDQMTVEECRSEVEHLDRCARSCAEIGQGISSKDVIRRHDCADKVALFDEFGIEVPDIREFMRLGRLMFAPAQG
jgi:hypothetical protein